jgi:hypothetical protein
MGCRAQKTNRARRQKPTARKRERNPPGCFTFLGGTSQRHRGALKISTRGRCGATGRAPIVTTASRRPEDLDAMAKYTDTEINRRHNGIEAP